MNTNLKKMRKINKAHKKIGSGKQMKAIRNKIHQKKKIIRRRIRILRKTNPMKIKKMKKKKKKRNLFNNNLNNRKKLSKN